MLLKPRVFLKVPIDLVLNDGNGFYATGDVDVALAGDYALCGERNGLKTRGAESVDGNPGDRIRTARSKCDLSADVAACSTFRESASHDHILDLRRIYLSSLERAFYDVTSKSSAVSEVERATPGFGQWSAGS